MPLFHSCRALPGGRSSYVRRRVYFAAFGLFSFGLVAPPVFASYPIVLAEHRASFVAYARAEKVRRRLESMPASERTRDDYERALDAYRRVYHADPRSPDAAPSIAAVAELLAQEGRAFHDARLSRDAVAQWEFLRAQYPGSPLRQRALLAQAAIEQQDLHDRVDAKKIYRSFLLQYPHNPLAEEAKLGLKGDLGRRPVLKQIKAAGKPSPSHIPDKFQAARTVANSNLTIAIPAASRNVPSIQPQFRSGGLPAPENISAAPAKTNSQQARQILNTADEASSATIQGIRYWAVQNATRVAVDMSASVPYHAYLSPSGTQITLIFFGAHPSAALLQHPVALEKDANLRSVRVIALTANQTELALQLHHPASFASFSLSNPDRLILDLHAAQASDLSAIAAKGPSKILRTVVENSLSDVAPVHTTVRNAQKKVLSGTRTLRNAQSERRATRQVASNTDTMTSPDDIAAPDLDSEPPQKTEQSLTRVLGLKIRRIVIDAGHGGHDSGTLGPGGLEEKDVALDVALRLGRLLQQRLGADVIYTRRTDRFIPLEERTAIANRAHADLFISVHANSSADPNARGVETYFLNFTASPAALAVAARENAVSNRSEYELSDLVRKITLSDKINESREFASDVQQALYSGLVSGNAGLKNRGVKQAPFVVLIGAHMPSVLAEISFLTNPLDAEELTQPAYRERLAEALYRGVARYIEGMSSVRVAKTVRPASVTTPAE